MEKILPLAMTNLTNTAGSEVLDILYANSSCSEEYFLSHSLMLQFNQRANMAEQYLTFLAPEYANVPFAEYRSVREDEGIQRDIITWLKTAIENNEYVFLTLNEKHTPFSYHFGKDDFDHHHLIYGISDEKKCVYARCNISKKGLFDAEVPFDVIEKASADRECCDIETLKYKNDFKYEIDMGLMYYDACRYAMRLFDYWNVFRLYLGLSVYNPMIDMIDQMMRREYRTDIRSFAILREHKAILCRYADFFDKIGITAKLENLESIQENFRLARNSELMFMKAEIRGDLRGLDGIKANIEKIYENESIYFPSLAYALREYLDEVKWNKPMCFNTKEGWELI